MKAQILRFRSEDLERYVERFLNKLGVPLDDARLSAKVLVAADLRGVSSHGIIRLQTYYGRRIRDGLIDPLTPIIPVYETSATATLDAGNGLGMVAASRAMERCIRMAKNSNVAVVTVRNSNHYGIAGYYAMMALQESQIGISLTNAQPLVAPTYGRTAMLGTNPIAVAVPSASVLPFVLDMATSIVPIGKVTLHEKTGEPVPLGWGMDARGTLTNDPAAILKGGALSPLGGSDILRGYKGYDLAVVVDILSGILSGSGFGVSAGANDQPARIGHFFMVINIGAFRPLDEFKRDMATLMDELKNAPKAEGQERIYLAGEKEFEMAAENRIKGIPFLGAVIKELDQAGREMGVPFDLKPVAVS
ncbi:MAG: Ldh family oxidoreductase [Anaerolineaceae bacterium]|nr:Ldh family oxidoreductase [Anaerolineaceae bacterium]MBN2676903.1 Ldh family oxidoreductase [Anaerolineaceae bacterium]